MMAAAQAGDAASYRVLLGEICAWLRCYYHRRLPPAMVDDAVQDALLAVHAKRHTYDAERPFVAWLDAIARYKWIDRLRAMTSHPAGAPREHRPIADHGNAVSSASALEILLKDRKPAQADVVRPVELQRVGSKQASGRTGQTISRVKVTIHRGLERLSEMIQGRADAE